MPIGRVSPSNLILKPNILFAFEIKKSVYLKVLVDPKTEQAFRKILEIKGLTIQNVLDRLLRDYIFENLDCVMNGK